MHPTSAHVLKTFDYLVAARSRLFDQARPFTPRQHAQVFEIGLGSLLRTMSHIMICEWYYVQRMQGNAIPPYDRWPIRDEEPPAMPVIEAAWVAQSPQMRRALEQMASADDWFAPKPFDGSDEQDRPRRAMVSNADTFTQLVLHEVHHRAQAMNMLRHLGVAAEDLDYNELAYAWEPG
jgi:uncharacterized damage-inducible protein DinB